MLFLLTMPRLSLIINVLESSKAFTEKALSYNREDPSFKVMNLESNCTFSIVISLLKIKIHVIIKSKKTNVTK